MTWLDLGRGAPYAVQTDLSNWPLAVAQVPAEISPAELRRYLRWWGVHVLGRREPFAMLLDARGVERFSALCRKQVIDAMAGQRGADGGARCAACALLLSSRYVRALSEVIVQAANPGYPVRTFDDPEPAATWARAELARCAPRQVGPLSWEPASGARRAIESGPMT